MVALLGVALTTACASQVRTVDTPDATNAVSTGMAPSATMPEPPTAGASEQPPEAVPSACASQHGSICLPTASFVQRLCSAPNPDVALNMFAKGTPWTRGYLRRPTEAWDAIRGGREAQMMKLGEEVLVIAHRGAPKGEMSVGTGGSYDVLRWDGHCVSLMEDEVGLRKPSQPTYANIPWKRLGERVRVALASDRVVEQSSELFRKECKGWGAPSPACSKADDRLSSVVVEYVRTGGSLPAPAPLP
jgi:hypothetical protein